MTGRSGASPWLIWQLADSAFPTGGFAHSFGLEAAWHAGEVPDRVALEGFVAMSLLQAGYGTLPLVTTAYRDPARLAELDARAEAFLVNPVINRASRVQGRALLSTCARVWPTAELEAVRATASTLHGHTGPLTGAVLRAVGVPLWTVQELVLFLTARGVLSAAVRLGVAGSYDAQRLLSDAHETIARVLDRCARLEACDLSQAAPILDLLHASHDRLYSRLFQS